jgi:membrane fusion protein, multidrug efflux system
MSETNPVANPEAGPSPKSWFQSPIVLLTIGVGLVVALYFGLTVVLDAWTHESTDDAFIAGHIISLAPRISGPVVTVAVRDNQLVRSNDLLVELDPVDLSLSVAQKQAAADAQQASYKTMLAGWELMQVKVTTAEAALRVAKSEVDADEAAARKAQADFDRAVDLRKQNTTSQAEFDAAQEVNTHAQANLKSAQETVRETESKVDEANRTLAAAWAQANAALAQWHETQTNLAVARQNFSYTKITAPAAGRITRKAVEPGDYVVTGQQLFSLVPAEVWVIANFKESQLRDMQPNQPVTVEIDALGGRKFAAHVDSIQAGSGAAFSLLPPENATGNFVKVVQRVPVKIVFDDALPADHVIGPGLSVAPSVQTSKFVFPAWGVALIAALIVGKSAFIFIFVSGRKSGKP